MFGEHSKGLLYKLDPGYAVSDNSWNSGRWYDTLFATLYPLNLETGNNVAFSAMAPELLLSHRGGQLSPGVRTSPSATARSGLSRIRSTSWTFNTGNADSYSDAMPDNTTFMSVPDNGSRRQVGIATC